MTDNLRTDNLRADNLRADISGLAAAGQTAARRWTDRGQTVEILLAYLGRTAC